MRNIRYETVSQGQECLDSPVRLVLEADVILVQSLHFIVGWPLGAKHNEGIFGQRVKMIFVALCR